MNRLESLLQQTRVAVAERARAAHDKIRRAVAAIGECLLGPLPDPQHEMAIYLNDPFQQFVRQFASVVLIVTTLTAVWTLASPSVCSVVTDNGLVKHFLVAVSDHGPVHVRTWHLTRLLSAVVTLFLYFFTGSLKVKARVGIPVDWRFAAWVFLAAHLLRFACSAWTLGCGGLLLMAWGLEHLDVVVDATPRLP